MQIPYEVTARPDTGLWNAKIGIWLFLASEVMLFGGLFSAYVFLRLGVTDGLDNPWPERQLIVWPGFLNTLVLIASSVFVVLAWSELKMRNFKKYQFWMTLVVLCALVFMGLKSYEYYGKFTHHGMKFEDESVVEGKLLKNLIEFEATAVTVNTGDDWLEFIKDLKEGSDAPNFRISGAALAEFRAVETKLADAPEFGSANDEEFVLTKSWMQKMKAEGDAFDKYAKGKEEEAKANGEELTLPRAPRLINLQASSSLKFDFRPRKVLNYNATEVAYRDAAKITGELVDDKIYFEVHDIDLRMTADREHATVWKYLGHHQQEAFFKHSEERAAELAEMGVEHPKPKELLWMHVHAEDHHYPEIEVEREDKKFLSSHGPSYNTYYAIYFTMTGLHGLHVIIGALILTYFLLFQKKLYLKNPEHLANRVEVGGLFWHFVDLVWIFLFPVMYLM